MRAHARTVQLSAGRQRRCRKPAMSSRKVQKVCDWEEGRFGVACGEEFTPLSNFTLDYVYEVRAGSESGFLASVTLFSGKEQG